MSSCRRRSHSRSRSRRSRRSRNISRSSRCSSSSGGGCCGCSRGRGSGPRHRSSNHPRLVLSVVEYCNSNATEFCDHMQHFLRPPWLHALLSRYARHAIINAVAYVGWEFATMCEGCIVHYGRFLYQLDVNDTPWSKG